MPLPDIIYPGGAHIESTGAADGTSDGTVVVFHAEKAAARPIERWRTKEGFQAWLRSYAEEAQEVESVFWDVLVLRFPDYAFGATLDMLGRIVGVGRDGRSDPAYRARIKAQIRINQSFGRPQDITAVLNLVTESAFRYREYETGSAFFAVIFEESAESDALAAELAGIIFQTKAAGVGASLTRPAITPGLLNSSFRAKHVGAADTPGEGCGHTSGYYGGALSHYVRG